MLHSEIPVVPIEIGRAYFTNASGCGINNDAYQFWKCSAALCSLLAFLLQWNY